MASGDKCRECGAAIPADSPGGFCAQCLLALGLEQNPAPPDVNDAPQDAESGVPPSGGPGPAQAGTPNAVVAPSERPGDRIGRYRLLQEIGHGGCGVVYMAEQEEPVRRKVALKVIKLGMDTRQVVARFEAERQALALMDHPNIAKILDAGVTGVSLTPSLSPSGGEGDRTSGEGALSVPISAGRPYFVMELVGGIKITDYCDQNQLTTRQRLDLFIQVCRAIQHAHQKGIIHRDIKPSNILVATQDGAPVPKVIDFGIAKATQGRLTDQTLFTAFEQFLGTPAYMSPEQAQLGGLDIDTRSDIYSLGVLLYELLTGATPFETKELMAAGLDEMRRTIREVEPVKPSTRLTQELVAADVSSLKSHSPGEDSVRADSRRLLQVKELIHSLRGDLDWIVMKCLEKDRSRRYETANGLARDIERHLNNEPVIARPPSKLYEFQKTVRRHKFGFAAATAIILVLAFGVAVSMWEAIRAKRAELEESNLRAAEAKQRVEAQQFLYRSLLGEARATRLVRRVGYRDTVFTLLEQAKALDVPEKNLSDLRRQATACLGDFVGLTPATFTDFPTNLYQLASWMDSSGKVAVFQLLDGTVLMREMPSGRELAHLTCTNGIVRAFCLNSTGDKLFAMVEPEAVGLKQSMPKRWVNTWVRDGQGRWREPESRPLPGATTGLFSTGTGVFDLILEIGSLSSGDTNTPNARFRLLDLTTQAFVPGYEVTNSGPGAIDFCISGDGRVLAVLVFDGPSPASPTVLNLYDFKAGARIAQLHLENDKDARLGLSADGKYLSSFSDAGAEIYAVAGPTRIVQFKESYPHGQVLIAGDKTAMVRRDQNHIRLWDLARGEDIARLDEPEYASPAAIAPKGDSLLTVGSRHVRFYRLVTPEKLEFHAHSAPIPGVAFSPDGTSLASVGKDRAVCVSDALTGRTIWQANDLPGFGQSVSYSPDGKWLAISIWDRDLVCIRDAQTGARLIQLGTGGTGQACSAQFSPDGHYLATAGDASNGIKIWEIASPKSASAPETLEAKLVKSWAAKMGFIGLQFAPTGASVAFASLVASDNDRPLYIWDFAHSVKPFLLATQIVGMAQCVGFTPDGRDLIAMDVSGNILTLNAATGNLISSFLAEDSQFAKSAIEAQPSPDGSKLALAANTGFGCGVNILESKTGKLLFSLPAEAGNVFWLTWSPDGRRVALGLDNGNITIWNLETVNQILAKLGLSP